MKVITLAKTKELLGINDTSQDTQITAKIPFIDALVKRITKNRFNFMILGNTEDSNPYITVSSIITYTGERYDYDRTTGRYFCAGINNPYCIDDLNEYLEIGQQIEGTGIQAEAYIDEVYYNGDLVNDGSSDYDVPTIKLSSDATATTAGVRLYLGMNIAYQPVVAKGIQFQIDGTNTTLPCNAVASKSFGPVSTSYSQADTKIDNKYGMPAWFVKAFPKYMSGK